MRVCPCWDLKGGCYSIAWVTVASSVVWMALFAWQTAAISHCNDNVVTTSVFVDACHNMPSDCPCNDDTNMDKLSSVFNALFIIQVVNVVFEAMLFFGALALVYGILGINAQWQGTKAWFWLFFPAIVGCILATSCYCLAWWASGVLSGYWIFLTIFAAVTKAINIYGFVCVCALYRRLQPIPKYYYEMVPARSKVPSDTLTYRSPESSAGSQAHQNGQPRVHMYRHDEPFNERKIMASAPETGQGPTAYRSGETPVSPKRPIPAPRMLDYDEEPGNKSKDFIKDPLTGQTVPAFEQAPPIPPKRSFQPNFVSTSPQPSPSWDEKQLLSIVSDMPKYDNPSPLLSPTGVFPPGSPPLPSRRSPTYQVPSTQSQQIPMADAQQNRVHLATNAQIPNAQHYSKPQAPSKPQGFSRDTDRRTKTNDKRETPDKSDSGNRRRSGGRHSSDSDYDDLPIRRSRSKTRPEENRKYYKRNSSRDRSRHSDRDSDPGRKSPHQRRMENRHRRSGHFDSDREGHCRNHRRGDHHDETSMRNSRSAPDLKERSIRFRRDSGHAVGAATTKPSSSNPDMRESGRPFTYTQVPAPGQPGNSLPRPELRQPQQHNIHVQSEYKINMSQAGRGNRA